MEYKFEIGEKVKHMSGHWTAIVRDRLMGYSYGLGGRSTHEFPLYLLKEEDGTPLLGLWGEPELDKL